MKVTIWDSALLIKPEGWFAQCDREELVRCIRKYCVGYEYRLCADGINVYHINKTEALVKALQGILRCESERTVMYDIHQKCSYNTEYSIDSGYCVSRVGRMELEAHPAYRNFTKEDTELWRFNGDIGEITEILDRVVVPSGHYRVVPVGTKFGNWEYTGTHLERLIYHGSYVIKIELPMTKDRMYNYLTDWSENLDYITPEDIGNFVLALDMILDLNHMQEIHHVYWHKDSRE